MKITIKSDELRASSAMQHAGVWPLLGRCMFVALVSGCSPPPPAATVPGPESTQLLPTVTGYFVMTRPPGGIVAFRFPTLQESVVRPQGQSRQADLPTIHALSGPDRSGRLAYVEDHFFVSNDQNKRHVLKTIKIDGTEDTEIFTRAGSAMWATTAVGNGEIGDHLALAPTGSRVAFLSELVSVQMPSALLSVGTVEIWNVVTKSGGKKQVKALDMGLAWFPDGRRLAYVKLIDARRIDPTRKDGGTSSAAFQGWEKVPAVSILDLDSGRESFLHVGWLPIVSGDGKSVLVSANDGMYRLVDAVTGKSALVSWPGAWGPIALPAKDVVLSLCLPTQGGKVKYTQFNSPISGPKQMLALKLAMLNGSKFQTVLPYVDPRMEVSFGKIDRN